MSLIHDALKQARQAPPRPGPNVVPPLRPVEVESSPVWGWLLLGLIGLALVAGIFFIGWSVAHQQARRLVTDADWNPATQAVATVQEPVVAAPPAPAIAPAPAPPSPPKLPVLQGIFYSPAAPSAIVNGKTVRPGGQLDQYLVKAIGKNTVTLVGPDKREIKLGMSH